MLCFIVSHKRSFSGDGGGEPLSSLPLSILTIDSTDTDIYSSG